MRGGKEEEKESYLRSQLGNHSSSLCGHSEINFQFQFPCFCVSRHLHSTGDLRDLPLTVRLKQIVCMYFFQLNCFLDQCNMMSGESKERILRPTSVLAPLLHSGDSTSVSLLSVYSSEMGEAGRPLFHRFNLLSHKMWNAKE